jgi:hypothetical protein
VGVGATLLWQLRLQFEEGRLAFDDLCLDAGTQMIAAVTRARSSLNAGLPVPPQIP